VYVAEKRGQATIARWTPNEVTVQVSHARPGDHLILNQNWDPGWSANGRRTQDWADLPAAVLSAESETVVFRYVPSTLWPGLGIFATAVAGMGWLALETRRVRKLTRGRGQEAKDARSKPDRASGAAQ